MFLFLSLLFSFLSFLTSSPVKSSFFLVISMVMFIFGQLSFFTFWLNYFLILLFLSGIFVVILYLSGLSWEAVHTPNFIPFLLVFIFQSHEYFYFLKNDLVGGYFLENLIYWLILFSLILFLLFIMGLFLTEKKSLRKLI